MSEGIAGNAHLTAARILRYAASHTLLFLVLAYGFAWLAGEPKPARERSLGPRED